MARLIRAALLLGALAALVVPLAAFAHGGYGRVDRDERERVVYATDTSGNLLSFEARSPRRAHSTAITGLPAGVALRGIDFRPSTGDLYALGSDNVVYSVNVQRPSPSPRGRRSRRRPPR